MTTGNDTQIRQDVYDCKRDDIFVSPYKWPNQGQPSYYDRKIWKEWLNNIFGIDQNDLSIEINLGQWKECSNIIRWNWYYHPHEDKLYGREEQEWREYAANHSRT